MLTLLKSLRAAVDACDADTPASLRKQIVKQERRLRSAALAVQVGMLPADDAALRLVCSEGTVPVGVLQLLDRVLKTLVLNQPSTSASGSSCAQSLGKDEAAVVGVLLGLCLSFIELCSSLMTDSPDDDFKIALLSLLAAQPCGTLAAALRVGAALPQQQPVSQHAPGQQICRTAAQCVGALLSLAIRNPSFLGLCPQLSAPGLWALTSCAISAHLAQQPLLLACANNAAFAFIQVGKLLGKAGVTALDGGRVLEALFSAMAGEHEFGSMLMNAAAAPRQHARTHSAQALDCWLERSPVSTALPLTAQHVIDLANVSSNTTYGPSCFQNGTMLELFQRLTHSKQQRAFPAVAEHTARAMDRASRRSLAIAAARCRDVNTDDSDMHAIIQLSVSLPSMLVQAASGHAGTQPRAAKRLHDLALRARWLVQHGLVDKCEALLRARCRCVAVPATPCGCHELRCTVNVAALLMDTTTTATSPTTTVRAEDALAGALSTLASQRKALTRWARQLSSTRAGGGAAAPAAAAIADLVTGADIPGPLPEAPAGAGLNATTPAAASVDPTAAAATAAAPTADPAIPTAASTAAAAAAAAPAAAADGCGGLAAPTTAVTDAHSQAPSAAHDLMAALLEASALTQEHALLRGGPHHNASAVHVLLICSATQLLPLLVTAARRCLHAAPVGPADAELWKHLLGLLADTHLLGLSDLSFALGVPALLLHLVRTLPRDLPNAVHLLERAVAAAHAAAAGMGTPWVREAARLSLLEECEACLASLPTVTSRPHCVEVCAEEVPPADDAPLDNVEFSAADLMHRSSVSRIGGLISCTRQSIDGLLQDGDGTEELGAPTWDRQLLVALAQLGEELSGGPYLTPFVGCCYLRCQNFSGDSERALKLRRCGGCKLARYCGEECQRKAWRAGHRAACLDWQEEHPSAAWLRQLACHLESCAGMPSQAGKWARTSEP